MVQDFLNGLFLRFHHDRFTAEMVQVAIDSGGFNNGAFFCQISPQNRKSPIGGIGVSGIADTTTDRIGIQVFPLVSSREWLGSAHSPGSRFKQFSSPVGSGAAAHIPIG